MSFKKYEENVLETTQQLQRNLELWARIHPKEAVLIPYIEDETLQFCQTEKGELNLCRQTEKGSEIFYASTGAQDEANEWFKTINQEHEGVLYVYGIGLGYYYQAAKQWLHQNPNRSLVFLEDDAAVLRKFLEQQEAEHLLRDSQVHLIYLQDMKAKKEVLNELYWQVALASAQVSALRYYRKAKRATFETLEHDLTYSAELKKSLLEEYLEYGSAYFANCYQNLLCLPHSYRGNHFFGQFPKVPAIICGAGPSLEKNMHLLKRLKERALIFAGGSAINILNSGSIQPHLCAGIDPNTAQNVRLHHAQAYEIPFFYRNRLNHQAFNTIHGPHLFLTGSGGYEVGQYFESQLEIKGEDLDEGHNVVTFCMEIAQRMGCDPILFVGLDLAFTDRKTYSEGVVFDPNVEQKTLDEYANFETTGYLKKDIYGEPIYSLWKWVAESEWVGEWVAEHPKLRVINCTEGGLGFPGVENMPLKEAVEKYLHKQSDLSGQIHTEIQNGRMPQVTKERVKEAMQELKESLVRCQEDLSILIEDLVECKEKVVKELFEISPVQSGRAALAEIELSEEVGYSAVIDVFNQAYSFVLNSRLQKLKREDSPLSEHEKHVKRLELNIERLRFLFTAANMNCQLMDYAFTEEATKEGRSHVEKEVGPKFREEVEDVVFDWKDSVKLESGAKRLYYASGALKAESYYLNGLLHGPSHWYTEEKSL
ncbi:MAG: motility associated factor glycosyltransferase family protein, partial [Parachlamydiaceae bacterium]